MAHFPIRQLITATATVITVLTAPAQKTPPQTKTPPQAQTPQTQTPTQTAKQTFRTQYPAAHLTRWTQDSNGSIASFRLNRRKTQAFYTLDGTWTATEFKIKWTRELPPHVRNAWLDSGYAGWQLMEMKKIQTPQQTLYMIHVAEIQALGPDDADIGREFKLFFDATGRLVKKERL